MRERPHTIHVLAIQFWIHDPGPLQRVLEAVGFLARIKRVDIEPALHAALARQSSWDLIVVDPATPDLSIVAVQRAMKALRCKAPLIVMDDVGDLADRIHHALRGSRS